MPALRFSKRLAPLFAFLALAPIALFAAKALCAQDSRSLEGSWTGILGKQLHVVLTITKSGDGNFSGALDSVDQHSKMGMTNIALNGDAVRFDISDVGGAYRGTLSKDGKSINGTWTQTGVPSQPLNFVWQSPAETAKSQPEVVIPAKPPVALANLKAALDEAFAPVIAHGALTKSSGHGLVIGVYDHGQRQIFAYGAAQPDSIFEIGSITKAFTALILAQMVEQKKVSMDDPVRDFLPPGTVAKPAGREITLLDLATQHSGLPRMPANFHPASSSDPYADYHAAQLYEFLAKQGVARPDTTEFLYSNLGFGLLGQALANRAGVPYAQLVQTEVLGPLHISDTGIADPPGKQTRIIQGYSPTDKLQGRWHQDVFAGAGALVSTAADMLTYLEAQLHPDRFAAAGPAGSPLATLAAAIALTHEPRADAPGGSRVGLAWLCDAQDTDHTCFHDGGTGGYTSFANFSPGADRAVIVLYNHEDISVSAVPYTERVVSEVEALMDGKPTYPLDK